MENTTTFPMKNPQFNPRRFGHLHLFISEKKLSTTGIKRLLDMYESEKKTSPCQNVGINPLLRIELDLLHGHEYRAFHIYKQDKFLCEELFKAIPIETTSLSTFCPIFIMESFHSRIIIFDINLSTRDYSILKSYSFIMSKSNITQELKSSKLYDQEKTLLNILSSRLLLEPLYETIPPKIPKYSSNIGGTISTQTRPNQIFHETNKNETGPFTIKSLEKFADTISNNNVILKNEERKPTSSDLKKIEPGIYLPRLMEIGGEIFGTSKKRKTNFSTLPPINQITNQIPSNTKINYLNPDRNLTKTINCINTIQNFNTVPKNTFELNNLPPLTLKLNNQKTTNLQQIKTIICDEKLKSSDEEDCMIVSDKKSEREINNVGKVRKNQ